jgi:hypothetical protein
MKSSDNLGFPTKEGTVLLSSLYLAPVEYYSKLFRASKVQIEIHDHYTKQSYRNRCIIAGANGPLPLSIPIEKPSDLACEMKDIRIADHGNWRHLHWNAIVSAYKSTPFFDYYADCFSPFYEKKIPFLLDFNEQLRNTICRLLEISTPITFTESFVEPSDENQSDFRERIHPKRDWKTLDPDFVAKPYYQVFEQKFGFLPNLSIIDLLFNMGNESRLFL